MAMDTLKIVEINILPKEKMDLLYRDRLGRPFPEGTRATSLRSGRQGAFLSHTMYQ
jgi:hypothetical protein